MKRRFSLFVACITAMIMSVGLKLTAFATQTAVSPSTGDISDAALFAAIAAVALILVIVMSILSKRRKK